MKNNISICFSIVLLVVAFWLGEEGKGLFQIYPYMLGVIGFVTIPYLASKKWKYRTAIGITFTVLYFAAFYSGELSFYRSFNVCIGDAEGIRAILGDYKDKNSNFPETLQELHIKLPCSRVLRGTILKYVKTETGYRIWFEDWLVEHSATESIPFTAHK
jgi:hypothetical protein